MTAFAPLCPTITVAPTKVAADTYVIHSVQEALGQPLFATPLPDPGAGIADLETEFWEFGLTLFALGAVSPWLSLVDPKKYGKYVDRVQNLDITTVAGCHTPVIEGPFIEQAFSKIRQLPSIDCPPMPDQSVLDEIIAATAVPQA